MCGIIGVTSKVDTYKLYNSLEKIIHRGADETSVFQDDFISLGHVRLSIIDLNPVNYPMVNEDKTIFAIVNGEFYNFKKIRTLLQERGHIFSTNTDSEIVVHLYEEYGTDFIHHLNGEFAFIIYDKRKKNIIVARDRFGIKPLYFTKKNEDYYFASEIKCFSELGIEISIDKENFLICSSTQYTPSTETIFKDIYHVTPGYIKVIHLLNKNEQNFCYWDINFKEGEYSIENLRNSLVDAVKERLISDVPVCCQLSGGIDSSIIFGISNTFQKIDAVTIEFENSEFNESEIAKRTAHKFNSNISILSLNSKKVIDNFEEAVYFAEGMTINSHLVAKYLLGKLIKEKNYKVVLTGEGSDELFCGYPHFKKDLNIQYKNFKAENKISMGIMNSDEPSPDYTGIFVNYLGYIPDFFRVKSIFGQKILSFYTDEFKADFNLNDIPKKILKNFDINKIKDYNKANISAYLWSKIVLSNYILNTLGDGTEMAHTIEGRIPFLDYRLWEVAGKIPLKKKVSKTIEKKVLRDTFKLFITDEVYKRTKQPFITPPYLMHEKEYLLDNLSKMPNFINKRILEKFLYKAYDGTNNIDFQKHEAILFFLYSTMHLLNKLKVSCF